MPLLITRVLLGLLLIFLGLADLKYRVAPAVEIFFFGSVLLAILYQSQSLLQIGAVTLSVAYGALALPGGVAVPLALLPFAWPSLLVGYGVRKALLGRGDLFAIAGISAMYSFDVAVVAILGTVFWARWWQKKYRSTSGTMLVPLLPGMAIGMVAGVGVHVLLSCVSG